MGPSGPRLRPPLWRERSRLPAAGTTLESTSVTVGGGSFDT